MKSYRFLIASERERLGFLQGPAPGSSVFVSIPYLSLESWMTLTTMHWTRERKEGWIWVESCG